MLELPQSAVSLIAGKAGKKLYAMRRKSGAYVALVNKPKGALRSLSAPASSHYSTPPLPSYFPLLPSLTPSPPHPPTLPFSPNPPLPSPDPTGAKGGAAKLTISGSVSSVEMALHLVKLALSEYDPNNKDT